MTRFTAVILPARKAWAAPWCRPPQAARNAGQAGKRTRPSVGANWASWDVAAPIGVAAGPALADQAHEAFAHPMLWGAWGWAGMILGPLLMIAVLAAVVTVAVLLVRRMGGAPATGPAPPGKTPLDILNERSPRARSTRRISRSGRACCRRRSRLPAPPGHGLSA